MMHAWLWCSTGSHTRKTAQRDDVQFNIHVNVQVHYGLHNIMCRTFVCMVSSTAIHVLHLRKAAFRALYPPIACAARLSAETRVMVPRRETLSPRMFKLTPSS